MKRTVQPRKQRKRVYTAPLHKRGRMIASTLSDELRKKYGKRALPVHVGDTVEVMRGDSAGHKEKVMEVNRRTYRVYIKGVVSKKAKGEEVMRPLNASNLRITELALGDKRREAMIARK